MVINSFKTKEQFSRNKLGLPEGLNFQNYIDAWNTANFSDYFGNSVIVSVISVLITVAFGALASFFIARFNLRMSKWAYSFFLFGMLVPIHATLILCFCLCSGWI
jgi:raffinose/stachyose/melibiose transport system permease protein